MAKSPTGIIPEVFMFPARLPQVIEYLVRLPIEGDTKVDLLVGWAKTVGVTLNASQRNTVRHSGTDYSGFAPAS